MADVVPLDNVILPFDLNAVMSCSHDDVVLDQIVIRRRCVRIGPAINHDSYISENVVDIGIGDLILSALDEHSSRIGEIGSLIGDFKSVDLDVTGIDGKALHFDGSLSLECNP